MHSLQPKLRFLVAVLMLLSLVGSLLAFVAGTVLTQSRLLYQQSLADSQRISQALGMRVDNLRAATGLLADDPMVVTAIADGSDNALAILNSRALALRDRFDLGLVQIYNAHNIPRTNLLLSSLYRETPLLSRIGSGKTMVCAVNERLILISRADIDGGGAVVLGIDLDSELERLVTQYRLVADLGLRLSAGASGVSQIQVVTGEEPLFDSAAGKTPGVYFYRFAMTLGETPVELVLARSTSAVRPITTTGLAVMTLSALLTTAALLGLAVMLSNAIVRPVRRLSETAEAIAAGDLNRRVVLPPASHWLNLGRDDELEVLTHAFNSMVDQLQELYAGLEARVNARTRELAIVAEIAGIVASSLDLGIIVQLSSHTLRKRLHFHHVGIYLMDADQNLVELCEVRGEVGEIRKGHQVSLRPDSLIGAAASTHSPCTIPDVRRESRFVYRDGLSQTRSAAAIPILARQEVLGVLELQSLALDAFPAELVKLLTTLADQIAMGIQNAQRYTEEQKRRRFAEMLEVTGRVLTGNLDIKVLPGSALAALNTMVKFDRASLWLQEGDALTPLAQYGYSDERPLHDKRLRATGDLYQKLAHERQPLVIADVALPSRWQQRLWLVGDRAWLGAPMLAHGRVIGMICLIRNTPGAFTSDDALWVHAFASHAGIALENAVLYAEIATINARLEKQALQRIEASQVAF
ncbi:MAG: GAF domain-containing protein [Anaerolineae bacterium]|nr:GAF domain-containing protein [Anaerolineae bacterium]